VSHFGFDLDNTLIDYSDSCRQYSQQHGLSEVSSVHELRRLLNSDIESSTAWTSAQSWIYGVGLQYAFISHFAINLLEKLLHKDWQLSIHSHKTKFGPAAYGSVPFRELMIDWLNSSELQNFFKIDSNIFFYDDLDSKVWGIANSDLESYIDDLPKVFKHRNYPRQIRSYLYRSFDRELDWTINISNLKDIRLD
jgi:hypothetical protein